MRKRWVLTIGAALTLLLAACGEDGGSDSTLVEPIANVMMSADGFDLQRPDAECIAGGMVNDIGEERLIALGFERADIDDLEEVDFTPEELISIVDAMDDCVGLEDLLVQGMVSDGMDQADAECLVRAIDIDVIRGAIMSAGGGAAFEELGMEFLAEIMGAMADCEIDAFNQ